MRKPITIEFSEFAPDQEDFSLPAAVKSGFAAYPAVSGFDKAHAFATAQPISMTASVGAGSFVKPNGTPVTVVGTSTDILIEASATSVWTTATRAGSDYALAGGDFWEFVNFGGALYAAGSSATADPIQTYDLTAGTSFADVAGAPSARHLSVIRDFVVAGGTVDTTDGDKPSRVRWSAFQDGSSWTVSAVTQADYQDLDLLNPDVGSVRRIIGGEYGLVFCDRGIYRMQYVGSPLVFQFDNISPGLGTRYGNSVAQVGDVAYFWAEKGFYRVTAGGEVSPIGTQRVDNWIRDTYDLTAFGSFYGLPDPNGTRVMFVFSVLAGGASGIFYDYAIDKWGIFSEAGLFTANRTYFVYQSPTAGVRAIAFLQPSAATAGLQWLSPLTGASTMQITSAPVRVSEEKITIHRVRVIGRKIDETATLSIKAGADFAFGEDGFVGGLFVPEEREQTDLTSSAGTDSYACRLTGRDFEFAISGYHTIRGIQILEWNLSGQR